MNYPQPKPELIPDINGRRDQSQLTSEQVRELSDPKRQEQYRLAYRLQQARRSCPGCGDDGVML